MEETSTTPIRKSPVSPSLILVIVISLLLGFLIAMNLQQKKQNERVEIDAKQAELATRLASLNAERASLGKPPWEGVGIDSTEQIAARLTKDAATLAHASDRFQALLSEKDAIIAEKNKSLLTSEQARLALSTQLAKAQSQLDQTMADGAGVDSLKSQLDEARSRIEQLAKRPSEEEWLAAQLRISELEARTGASNSKPAPVKAPTATTKKSFAANRDELHPMAQPLFDGLRELDQKNDLEISAAYNRFPTQYKATFLKEVRFASDSSILNPADQIPIANSLSNVPEGAMILVVGYSSTAGDAEANRQLSSSRSQNIASEIDRAKPGKQFVQSFYFGSTQRFSRNDPERNHVCEIWQITTP